MTLKEEILEGFLYDQWANDLWDKTLLEWPLPQANITRSHITRAKQSWLQRLTGEELDLREAELDARYLEFVQNCDLTQELEYQNMRGESFKQPIHQILRHIILHGQYHRGQLRALAEADGLEWPETDLIFFHRQKQS